MISRKVYHKHGFLVQYKIGKEWIDENGVADTIDTILEMNGNPKYWRGTGGLGYEVYRKGDKR